MMADPVRTLGPVTRGLEFRAQDPYNKPDIPTSAWNPRFDGTWRQEDLGGFLASRLSSMGATSSERGHASKEYIKSDKEDT